MNKTETMRTHIRTSHVIPFVLVGAFTTVPAAIANAQIGSIGMGSMQMEAKIDEESEQLMVDAMNRRVRMSPSHQRITKESKTVTIEFHNPTKDTLLVDLFISDTIVPMSRYVSREPKATQTAKSDGKEFLSDDPADSISSLFRPMSSWVRGLEKTVSLTPGERKSITVNIDIPDSPLRGEYATWIAGAVRPRKTLTEAKKQVVYTISNTKITYDTEQNNCNAKSAQ